MMNQLLQAIIAQMVTDPRGANGLGHWARVYDNGLRLAAATGADQQVLELFALFHDSRRFTEKADPEHGPRAAELVRQFRQEGLLQLDEQRFQLLVTACRLHTAARTHEQVTVAACFDADRLDLARTGTTVNPEFLCTEAAKRPECIAWATQRSRAGLVPGNLLGQALRSLPDPPQ